MRCAENVIQFIQSTQMIQISKYTKKLFMIPQTYRKCPKCGHYTSFGAPYGTRDGENHQDIVCHGCKLIVAESDGSFGLN